MIGLQIDGKWAVLDEDVSISIEEQSPVWGEGNSYSFPFELGVEENRHIIGNSDQLTGQSVYDVLHGRPAVLYVQGIPFFYGKISIEDEIEIADGRIELNLVSGNKTFEDMIDGMNCQDVPLMDEIVVGEQGDDALIYAFQSKDDTVATDKPLELKLPPTIMVMEVNGVGTINVDKPYPQKAYCNTRICYQLPEVDDSINQSGQRVKLNSVYGQYISENLEKHTKGSYISLDAERPLSGLCFYVLYFLEALFKHLKVSFDMSVLTSVEDLNRLAFYTTKCEFDLGEVTRTIITGNYSRGICDISQRTTVADEYPRFTIEQRRGHNAFQKFEMHIAMKKCIANSKNFPDEDVSNIIEAMEAGFGIRFLFDKNYATCNAVFLKDILNDKTIKTIGNVEVYEAYKSENDIKGFCLTYSGDDSDTSYNYNEWENVYFHSEYDNIQAHINPYDKNLYVDENIGNAYRVKIDEDATSEETMYPSLFEVAAFNKATYGDCSDDDKTETVEIGFTPIVLNDLNGKVSRETKRARPDGTTSKNSQQLSVFHDVSMKYPGFAQWVEVSGYFYIDRNPILASWAYSYHSLQNYDITQTDQTKSTLTSKNKERFSTREAWTNRIKPLDFENVSPISQVDTGLTLGIMRGPGNDAGVEEFDEDYDNEGNVKYVTVPSDYAFSSDICDNYGNLFDYNGTEEGGVDLSGRFSLKLRAEKPVGEGGALQQLPTNYAKRGLFDKFYTEYAYFVTHRKIVKLTLHMELADLVGIDWTKRYKVGQYIGFINKVSYSVGQDGLGDVEMEMYYV